jgi:hypothetical protein
MGNSLLIVHTVMLLGALAAAASAVPEVRRQPMKRWQLLAPGLLATFSTTVLLAYPDILDLLEPQVWMLGLLAALAGSARGYWMGLDSDHGWGLVRLARAYDGLAVALAVTLFAAMQYILDLRGIDDSRYEPTLELVMILTSGFLFGRSIAAWIRAGQTHHVDLHEP